MTSPARTPAAGTPATDWADALDPALVRRLSRPAGRPGLIRPGQARDILERNLGMTAGLPLVDVVERHRALAPEAQLPQVPIAGGRPRPPLPLAGHPPHDASPGARGTGPRPQVRATAPRRSAPTTGDSTIVVQRKANHAAPTSPGPIEAPRSLPAAGPPSPAPSPHSPPLAGPSPTVTTRSAAGLPGSARPGGSANGPPRSDSPPVVTARPGGAPRSDRSDHPTVAAAPLRADPPLDGAGLPQVAPGQPDRRAVAPGQPDVARPAPATAASPGPVVVVRTRPGPRGNGVVGERGHAPATLPVVRERTVRAVATGGYPPAASRPLPLAAVVAGASGPRAAGAGVVTATPPRAAPAAAAEPGRPRRDVTPAPAPAPVDIDRIVDRVHRQFVRRLAIEGERRGLR